MKGKFRKSFKQKGTLSHRQFKHEQAVKYKGILGTVINNDPIEGVYVILDSGRKIRVKEHIKDLRVVDNKKNHPLTAISKG